MKNLFVTATIFLLAVSCSKKTTSSKTVAETPPVVSPTSPNPPAEQKKVEAEKDAMQPIIAKPATIIEEKKKIVLIAEGKEIYPVKCGKCHDVHEPQKFIETRWEKIIDWMGPRAKLEAHEKESILAYVKHNAKK